MARRLRGETDPKGTELIYATRQNPSFLPVSCRRRNQYIEVVGSLSTLEMFLDAITF